MPYYYSLLFRFHAIWLDEDEDFKNHLVVSVLADAWDNAFGEKILSILKWQVYGNYQFLYLHKYHIVGQAFFKVNSVLLLSHH